MEIKEYIESGILELFVLDQLDAQERSEVLSMASKFPEVDAELKKVEQTFEALAAKQEVEPKPSLRARIESSLIFSDLSPEGLSNIHSRPHSVSPQHLDTNGERVLGYSVKFYAYALAACFTLLIISAVGTYNLWNRLKETQHSYDELVSRSQQYGNQVAYLQGELGRSKALMNDPDFHKLALTGTKAFPASKAVVWWNKTKHTVMIDPSGLPKNDASHSYQLWAISKGKPLDAGVFEVKGDLASVSQLKDVDSAQAFAITIEKKGGSESPTLSAMVAMATI